MYSRIASKRAISATRSSVIRQSQRRLQSTGQSGTSASTQNAGTSASHSIAGAAGGALVFVGGYAYYHISGIKTAVDTATQAKDYIHSTAQGITSKAKEVVHSNNAVKYLRDVAKSYASVIPGAAGYIDTAFDSVDDLVEEHGDKVTKIATSGYEEIQKILNERKKGDSDVQVAWQVMEVLRQRLGELQELGVKAGGATFEKLSKASDDAVAKLSEQFPDFKEKVGGTFDELKELAKKQEPEVRELYEKTQKEVLAIFAKGPTKESIDRVRKLVQEATAKATELAGDAASDVKNSNTAGKLSEAGKASYDKLMKSSEETFSKLTEKFPELKDIVGGSISELRELAKKQEPEVRKLYEDAQKQVFAILATGPNRDAIEKVKKLVKDTTAKAQDIASDAAEDVQESDTVDKAGKAKGGVHDKFKDAAGKVQDTGKKVSGGLTAKVEQNEKKQSTTTPSS